MHESTHPESIMPRVAIVSANPIRPDQSNGMLMRSLWADWPRDRLSQVYFPTLVRHEPDWSACGAYCRIGLFGGTRRLVANNAGGAASPRDAGALRIVASLKKRPSCMQWLRAGVEGWSAHVAPIARRLAEELAFRKPDCVYALMGNYWLTRVTVDACRAVGVPMYLHVTDDFVTSLYNDSPFRQRLQRASQNAFADAVRYSSGRAAISHIMAEEYAKRYGKPWDWFTTLVDREAYDTSPRRPDGVLRFVYAGGLALGRADSLASAAGAIEEAAARAGVRAELVVYCPPEHLDAFAAPLTGRPGVRLAGWATPGELPRIFHDADVLMHVESFDPAWSGYTGLSFSTKLSQYMMAQRPILAVGPRGLGSMRAVAEAGAGFVADNRESLHQALERVFWGPTERLERGEAGRRWALRWFDCEAGRGRFADAIRRAVFDHTSSRVAA